MTTNQEKPKQLDAHTREEVGGILERAFRQEEGHRTLEVEQQYLESLSKEAEKKAELAEQQAIAADQAALRASERYAISHSLDDLDIMQRWEAEAASYRREMESYHLETERLKKYLPG
jgi:hypothetical protein